MDLVADADHSAGSSAYCCVGQPLQRRQLTNKEILIWNSDRQHSDMRSVLWCTERLSELLDQRRRRRRSAEGPAWWCISVELTKLLHNPQGPLSVTTMQAAHQSGACVWSLQRPVWSLCQCDECNRASVLAAGSAIQACSLSIDSRVSAA